MRTHFAALLALFALLAPGRATAVVVVRHAVYVAPRPVVVAPPRSTWLPPRWWWPRRHSRRLP